MSQFLGQTLGERYRIVSPLGSGGMGDVYLAEHVVLGKRMAVKVLKEEMTRDEELVQRFQQEAVAASRIGHENIVSVTDFGRTSQGAFYFVMEALAGSDLATLLHGAQGSAGLPLGRGLPILIQVSRALGAAHEQGIVHRDLKAENVMVLPRDDGTDLVKVLDFGISKMSVTAEGANPRLTRAGVLMGTPNYMAPEQARGDAVDLRSDVYSFGVLAYELITGAVPFEAPNVTGVLLKHMTEEPVAMSQRFPNLFIPRPLEALVMQMLRKDPAQRPQSMKEIRDELARIVRQLPAEALPATPPMASTLPGSPIPLVTPAPAPVGTLAPETPGLEKTWVRGQTPVQSAPPVAPRSRTLPFVLLVVGVVVVGGGAFAWKALSTHPAAPEALPPPVTHEASPLRTPSPAPVTVASSKPSQPVDSSDHVEPAPAGPAPSEVAAPAKPLAPHRLNAKDVARTFGKHSRQLRQCLDSHRDALPGKQGAISVSFVVLKSGAVKEAKVTTPGLERTPLGGCVSKLVKDMNFGPHGENAVAFEIPLQYDLKD